jgi:hypothetical protein
MQGSAKYYNNCMGHSSSWDRNIFSVSQEIPAFNGNRDFIAMFRRTSHCSYLESDE